MRKSVDTVAVVLGFRASILPFQVVWVPVDAADSEPGQWLGGIFLLEENCRIIVRMGDIYARYRTHSELGCTETTVYHF